MSINVELRLLDALPKHCKSFGGILCLAAYEKSSPRMIILSAGPMLEDLSDRSLHHRQCFNSEEQLEPSPTDATALVIATAAYSSYCGIRWRRGR